MSEQHQDPGEVRRSRRNRRLIVALVVVVVLATGGVVVIARVAAGAQDKADPQGKPVATVEVKKTDLADEEQITGKLGYGTERSIVGRRPGTLTWLPSAGDVIGQGEPLYKVDEKPVPLFFGVIPFYRELGKGADDGPDVRELEQNLRALGFGGFGTPDDTFTWATENALKRWQKSLDLEPTGTLTPGDVVVEKGQVRISEVPAQTGADGTGTLLETTGTENLVTVEVETSRQNLVKPGAKVGLSVAGGPAATGTVTSIGTSAASPKDDGQGPPNAGGEDPKISVTITFDDPASAGSLDSAPVEVTFTARTKDNVLGVPVGALLALAEGGYAVEVVDGTQRHLVPVRTGLFAQGQVEISGKGLRAGVKVVTTS